MSATAAVAADDPVDEGNREILVAAIPTGRQVQIRVVLSFDELGRPMIDVRAWRRDQHGGAFPTRHGLSILRRQLRAVIEALQRAEQLAIETETPKGSR